MAKTNDADTNLRNHIAQGTSIKGEVETEGDIRIDGELEGSISAKGKLVVGSTGSIKGDFKCQDANVAGSVEGSLYVSEMITLQSSGVFSGDLTYGKMSVEPGAALEGTFAIAGKVKDMHKQSPDSTAAKEKLA